MSDTLGPFRDFFRYIVVCSSTPQIGPECSLLIGRRPEIPTGKDKTTDDFILYCFKPKNDVGQVNFFRIMHPFMTFGAILLQQVPLVFVRTH